jgi:hypothetical protein
MLGRRLVGANILRGNKEADGGFWKVFPSAEAKSLGIAIG